MIAYFGFSDPLENAEVKLWDGLPRLASYLTGQPGILNEIYDHF